MDKSTLASVSALLEKLSQEQNKLHSIIRDAMIPGLQYSIENNWVHIDTTYFDQANPDRACRYFGASLSERIAFEIQDYDSPTSYSQGKRFCEFMGFGQKATTRILEACSSDEQYDHWADEEIRRYSY
jgi:hypothetical protein